MDMQELCEENGQYEIEQQEIFVGYCGLMMQGGIQALRNSRSFTREVVSILKLKSVEIPYEVNL